MKLCLVIPTRERARYLDTAIRSAIAAADNVPCDVEIIVSDNASNDETPQVVAKFRDTRLIFKRAEQRLSMRENFEFALSHTTGDYVVFIGDDDAVLPNGLRLLSKIISENDVDIIKWRVLNYMWPNPEAGTVGTLKVRPQILNGRLIKIKPAEVLKKFENARFRTYHEGGMIYHGCISRRLIEKAKAASGGPFFRGSSPDVFSAMQALMVSDRPMLAINLAVTMGGASPRSNGAAGQAAATSGGSIEGTEFASFVDESTSDLWQCKLPASIQSISMLTLDCLQTAASLHGHDLHINVDAWSKKVAKDIDTFGEPARSECLAFAQKKLGLDPILKSMTPAKATKQAPVFSPSQAQPTATKLKRSFLKLQYAGGDEMLDSATAAILLDELMNLRSFDKPATSSLSAVRNVVELREKAGRLARRPVGSKTISSEK